jgi:hypothetical protein
MTLRKFRLECTGHVTVDDTTLRAALLGLGFVPEPGVPDLTDAERLALDQQILDLTGRLEPARQLELYLASGPLEGFEDGLVAVLTKQLAGSRVAVGPVAVTEVPLDT